MSRSFIKDTKLRTVERYWRGSNDLLSSIHTSQIVARILPDARTLRKYLRLIRTLTTEYHDLPFQWILTESAVELMDHRNQSLQEAAAPQERNGVQRLVQQSTAVFAFADLSVRQEHDEWNFLHYESMTLTERSRQAHVRAAGLIAAAHGPPCWLLVDDDENDFSNLLPLDDDANMKYLRVQDFIDNLATRLSSKMHVERLNEIKRSCSEEYMRRNAQPDSDVNPNDELLNLSEEEIREHLKTGKLLRGRLNVTKENIRESYVTAGNQTLFVDHSNVNHTFHQDVVIIEPLPESKWGRPIGKRRLVYNVGDDEDSGESALDSAVPAVPSARVVCLDRPGRRVYVTTMIDMPNADEGAVLVIPMDMRIPKIRIRTRTWRRFEGQRLKVEVTAWEVGSQYPAGRCVEVLGPIGDVEVEIKALLIENQVELEPFSAEALACLPVEGSSWRVPDEEIQRRRDLRRSRRIFSVDPPGCQDIDDAMHAEILPNGDVEGNSSNCLR